MHNIGEGLGMPHDEGHHSAPRPQSLMLTFLGNYLLGTEADVYSGSVIEAFRRVGVGEQATRSTLTRMVNRGLLRRQRRGQRMYFGLTAHAAAVLADGERRVFRGAVNEDWDGSWTLLAFSLPDSSQRERHSLRSRLAWAGFGPLIGGLWIAPGHADVQPITEAPDFGGQVRVFRSTADPSTDVPAMVRQVWDLDTPAADYRAFAERWRALASGEARCADELAARLRLRTEWLRIVRADPRLPAVHLPAGWPAATAQDVFRRADARLDAPARAQALALLDTIPAAGT